MKHLQGFWRGEVKSRANLEKWKHAHWIRCDGKLSSWAKILLIDEDSSSFCDINAF